MAEESEGEARKLEAVTSGPFMVHGLPMKVVAVGSAVLSLVLHLFLAPVSSRNLRELHRKGTRLDGT